LFPNRITKIAKKDEAPKKKQEKRIFRVIVQKLNNPPQSEVSNVKKLNQKIKRFSKQNGRGPKKLTVLSLTIPTQFLVFSQNFF
jgi:hypothetical protein